MSLRQQLWKSSIGYKILMALSGVGLLVFAILHMAGNLQIFLGQETFNNYAQALKDLPLLLWLARLGLLAIVLAHIVVAFRLRRMRRDARPVAYSREDTVQASYASRSMLMTGVLILAFVIYHLLHFTIGVTNPSHFQRTDALGRHDVYTMVVLGFQNAFVSASYLVAMLLLGMHLSHGAVSFFQSLGVKHPTLDKILKRVAPVVVWGTIVGFVSVPVAVLLGWVRLPQGVM